MIRQVTLDYEMLLKHLRQHEPFAFAHYNDGEMYYILDQGRMKISRGAQNYNPALTEKLTETLLMDEPRFYRGIPCTECFPQLYSGCIDKIAAKVLDGFSIPTVTACVFHHHYVNRRSEFLKTIPTYSRVTWITDTLFDIGRVCKELGLDSKKQGHYTVPTQNGWDTYDQASELDYAEGELVFMLCGPSGRVLAGEGFRKFPKTTFLCLGSYFDLIASDRAQPYHFFNDHCAECCPAPTTD